MPHKPGHFKPFTSFLNQGMKNTNNQANNINMPPNPINTPMNNNTLDTPQFPDSAIRPPVEQPKPSSFLDNLTMNNKVTRNLMNPEQPGGGGQLFGESGGIFDYGGDIGVEGEQVVGSPYEEIDPAIGGGGGHGTAPDQTWQDYWDDWASNIETNVPGAGGMVQYADYNMTEGSSDYNYLMNQWQQFYNEAGGDVATASSNFHNWLVSGEYQPLQSGGFSDIGQTVDDELMPSIFPKEEFTRPKPQFETSPIGAIPGYGEDTGAFSPDRMPPYPSPDITDKPFNIQDYERPIQQGIDEKPFNIADYLTPRPQKPGGPEVYAPPIYEFPGLDKAYLGAGTGETGMEGIDPFDNELGVKPLRPILGNIIQELPERPGSIFPEFKPIRPTPPFETSPVGVIPGYGEDNQLEVPGPRIPGDAINIADFKPILPDTGGFTGIGQVVDDEMGPGSIDFPIKEKLVRPRPPFETSPIGAIPGYQPDNQLEVPVPRVPGDAINIADFKPLPPGPGFSDIGQVVDEEMQEDFPGGEPEEETFDPIDYNKLQYLLEDFDWSSMFPDNWLADMLLGPDDEDPVRPRPPFDSQFDNQFQIPQEDIDAIETPTGLITAPPSQFKPKEEDYLGWEDFEELPEGWEWQLVDGNLEPVELNPVEDLLEGYDDYDFDIDLFEDNWLANLILNPGTYYGTGTALDDSEYLQEGTLIPETDKPWTEELPEGYEWQLVDGNWEPVAMGDDLDIGDIDEGFGTGTVVDAPEYLQTADDINVEDKATLYENWISDLFEGYDDYDFDIDLFPDNWLADMLIGPDAEFWGGEELQEGWEWQLVDGNWEPVELSPGTGTVVEGPNYLQTEDKPEFDSPFLVAPSDVDFSKQYWKDEYLTPPDLGDSDFTGGIGQVVDDEPMPSKLTFNPFRPAPIEEGPFIAPITEDAIVEVPDLDWWDNIGLDEQDIIDSASNYDYDFNDDGVIDDLDYNAAADLLQGSDPNLLNLIMLNSLGISTPEAMTDFAGGAGVGGGPTGWGTWMEYPINVGGNLARRLAYPSTMGGFAGVGSGAMGPSSTSLEDLLAQLQG